MNLCANDKNRGQITDTICSYLTSNINRTQQVHMLPRMYRRLGNPPGRPLVTGSGGPTEKIQTSRPLHRPLNILSKLLMRLYQHGQHICMRQKYICVSISYEGTIPIIHLSQNGKTPHISRQQLPTIKHYFKHTAR